MESNDVLVKYLTQIHIIKSKDVEAAFRNVDRAKFVNPKYIKFAYENGPLPTYDKQTISQPLVVALMTERLNVKKGQNVLEIGAGSGYQAAILSELVGPKGRVFTIERLKKLYDFASKNLENYKNVKVIYGDGSKGYEKEAPYDRIILTASAENFPEPLFKQLKEGGRIMVPIGKPLESKLMLIQKVDGEQLEWSLDDVRFVPLLEGKG